MTYPGNSKMTPRFMTPRMSLAALVVGGALIASAAPAGAQTMSYRQAGALIAKSCGPAIEKYCGKVNIGTGEVLGCLQQHKAEVPPQCFADFSAVLDSIGRRVAAQGNAYRACQADVAEFCQGVQPGNGNLRDCLVASKNVVKGACRQVLVDAGWY